MGRLGAGIGRVRTLTKGDEITIFFPPASSPPPGVQPQVAGFPSWRVKVIEANEDALIVDLAGKMIGLSWDHIAGVQFAK